MVIFLLMVNLLSSTYAAQGKVLVLESPLFRTPDVHSKIIQYVHQGEVIFIHPSELDLKQESHPGFVLTKDNQGRDAWIIRQHVHVFYEDHRERAQAVPKPDPTDYRLREPLPQGYPLVRSEELRGLMNFSYGSPYQDNYPYNQKVGAESYGYQLELAGTLLRRLSFDPELRWYGGGMVNLRMSESDYSLETRNAQERWLKAGGGGVLAYDAWRTEDHRINLSLALLAYPFTQVTVTQSQPSEGSESRRYSGWNFASRLATQWQILRAIGDLDFVVGAWGELETPMEMSTAAKTNRPSWWKEGQNDSFTTDLTFTLGFNLGLQSTY